MIRNIREAQKDEEGFTLIELLVVVIIIGILAAIAIPAFLNQRERAWQAELTSTARNVALEVEAEATAFGGDYTDVAGATTTTFDGFITEALEDLQGATAEPVSYDDASSASTGATTTAFSVCFEHESLAAGSVTYSSADGGLQDFSNALCPA